MARTDSGEFELVLGNRQLLSLAAIIVILFGVFFTMGYIVGRNSTPFSQSSTDGSDTLPAASDRRPEPGGAPVVSQQAPVPAPEATEPAREATQPAQSPAETQAEPEPAAAGPEPGRTYLQVTAIARRDAEILVEALQKKGFPALIGAAPNGLFRVLVGPYDDRDALGKAKSDLESAGFKNAFVQRL
jgi:cell division septation protein DedD